MAAGGSLWTCTGRITARSFPSPLGFEYLSERIQPIVVAGTAVPNLSPEDTLLMLAIQITKDAGTPYFQLAKICDIAELLRAYPRLDLVQAVKQAKRLGGERMLLFSLGLTNNLVGAALSQEVVHEMRCYPSLDGLVEYARQQLFYGGDRPGPIIRELTSSAGSCENAYGTNYGLTISDTLRMS